MRLVEHSEESVEVTWFWAGEQTPFGPWTRFASGNWSSNPVWPWLGIGEVKGAPRPWYNGAPPWPLDASHFCGTPQEFAEGLPSWPDITQWAWCCTPWASRASLRLCPASAVELGPPEGYGPPVEFGPLKMPPWHFVACLCLDATSTVVIHHVGSSVPFVSAYSTAGPVVGAPSVACLCLDASSFALPEVAASYAPSSSAPARSAPLIPFPIHSTACLCLSASSFTSIPLGGSSPPSTRFAATSVACLCLSASSFTSPPPASSYAPSSSVPGRSPPLIPFAASSSACLCLDASSASAFKSPPVSGLTSSAPGYSVAAPFAASSKACLCLDASSFESPVSMGPYGYYGSSGMGGSSTGGGGNVPCIGQNLPATIFFHVSNAGPCNGVYAGPGFPPTAWTYSAQNFGTCMDPLASPRLVLSCNTPSPWTLTALGGVIVFNPISVSYHPTFIVFTGVDLSHCGGGSNATVIVEDS